MGFSGKLKVRTLRKERKTEDGESDVREKRGIRGKSRIQRKRGEDRDKDEEWDQLTVITTAVMQDASHLFRGNIESSAQTNDGVFRLLWSCVTIWRFLPQKLNEL